MKNNTHVTLPVCPVALNHQLLVACAAPTEGANGR
jgi:hypothetical protein